MSCKLMDKSIYEYQIKERIKSQTVRVIIWMWVDGEWSDFFLKKNKLDIGFGLRLMYNYKW